MSVQLPHNQRVARLTPVQAADKGGALGRRAGRAVLLAHVAAFGLLQQG